ncbi:MAG: ABC transporter ATP-binding protein [Candidatus Hecatellales archaeon]|nr:MAG: ABC transporter ATP-binding protein [Candidatus Hecatellales archaeon]
MDVIEIEGLTKRFGDVLAVDNVSFKVKKGEIFGFLGPNGAGKTTLLNILVTVLKPTSGTARVAGYDVLKYPLKVREKIGVVFQDITLDRELTGRENLWIHGRVYGVNTSRLKKRIDELSRFIELEKWIDVQVKKYSGGMMRRLEIARALIHNPEILFLDEPTLGLDPQTRVHVWDYIKRLRREHGITVFLTTHYMDEAEKLCDRVAIIDHGKIISMGKPEDLTRQIDREIVYVRVDEADGFKVEKMFKALGENGFVEGFRMLEDKTLRFLVDDASKAIPKIFEVLQGFKVRIREVKYSKPTLEDVFLQLTGKSLREYEAGFVEHVRLYHRRR